jgi:glycosyltransferase involved in cell wall biosynthesis
MIKLSIIVPVYNTEKYLRKCLESLVNQSLKPIEIIIVNDGSSDNSQNIIDEYVKKYPTMCKCFIQENLGQAKARNVGIDNALGEFITFADSDDYLELSAYEKAYNCAIENNLDIVSFDFFVEDEKKTYIKESSYYLFNDCDNNIKYILNETSAWNKIIKKRILDENKIRFKENMIYEDLELIPRLLFYTEKIGFLEEHLYHYIVRENSTMRQKKYNKKLEDIFIVMESLKNSFKNSKYNNELEYLYIEHLLHGATLRYLEYEEGKNDIIKIADIMKKEFGNWRKNSYYKTKELKYKIVCNLAYKKRIWMLKKILKK